MWYVLLIVFVLVFFLVSDIIFNFQNDDDDFESPVPCKREHKPAYFMKSPFINEFGSSDISTSKKAATVVKDMHPFTCKIDENVDYQIQSKFDEWMAIGLKKKNKYVFGFWFLVFMCLLFFFL